MDHSPSPATGGEDSARPPGGAEGPIARRTPSPQGRRAALLVFAALLLVTRFAALADRPLHHDESIHAFQSYTLSKDGTWRYDPAYHGPFLYYANALVYKIAGVTNATARFLPALFGVGLALFAIPLASWFGFEAAVAFALLVLISPHFAYFSRFIREDLYSLVFTVGTIVAFRRFLETDRSRWLTLSAVSFALAGATKENAYMTGVLFVLFGIWVFLERALARPAEAPAGVPGTKPPSGPSAALRATVAWTAPRVVPILIAATVFLCIWSLLYTAFGRYPGDWLAIPKAVRYWMGQHAIARIPGPWYYYFPQLLMYETGILAAALLVLRRPEVRRDPFLRSIACAIGALGVAALMSGAIDAPAARWIGLGIATAGAIAALVLLNRRLPNAERAAPFLRFVVYWALASLAIYGWAREKVPWLTVHPLLPVTILAAIGLADLWRERARSGPRLLLAGVFLLLAVNATGMYLACFRYGAHDIAKDPGHAEMLAYVQTSRDLVRALDSVEKARARVPAGQPLITVTGEASWPLTWYLRDVQTRWLTRVEDTSTPIIVADWDAEGGLQKQLAEHYTATRVPIRAWWFPGRVAAADKTPARPTAVDLLRYWLFHEIWSPIGSQDTTFYVRKDLGEGTGPLPVVNIVLKDSTARDYNGEAGTIPPLKTWGTAGTGAGELGEPRGIASDSRGQLYVADTKNSRIQVFDNDGKFLRQFGSKGKGPGEFNEPCGIAVDAEGDIWVADTWNARIARFSGADGKFMGAIGPPENAFFGPRAVVVSRNFVYVADTGNKKIVRFDRDGKRLNDFGGDGSGPGEFVEPVGLAADASGNLYVADTGNHRVQVFDPEGKFLRQFPVSGWKDFYTEPYLAIAGDMLLVTDAWGGRVAAYDAKGVMRRSWKADRDFKQPTGITVDAYGRVTVTDRGTNRIFSWALPSVLP
ncbi:MAG: TIGR03663 family protein [Acidobacteria bacterium]|nr:TIGR03663 family protein [Acidobacteriota bacterium]